MKKETILGDSRFSRVISLSIILQNNRAPLCISQVSDKEIVKISRMEKVEARIFRLNEKIVVR